MGGCGFAPPIFYNNTKDGNITSPWIPFAKQPTWAGNTYTSRPWFQTGLYYCDIKFAGAGVERWYRYRTKRPPTLITVPRTALLSVTQVN